MADVRALLRQQRAARRITHPYATYSDTGKLLCTLCRDLIRAESHWDAHLASDKHRKRLSAISATQKVHGNEEYRESDEVNDQEQSEGLDDIEGRDQRADTPSSTHKRKLDHVAAATAADEHDTDKDIDDEDEARRKRSRHASPDTGRRKQPQGPSQGVQVQMPSRSTTPADSQHSGSSAAKTTTKLATSLPSRQASNLATPASSSSMSIQQQEPQQQEPKQQQQPLQPPASTSTSQTQQIDEDEWAAFEADIAAESAPYDADAVISRPAMTAEEAAAAKEAAAAEQEAAALQNPESRRTKADADIEDEREEATRALEDEFEEMQELEARVRRLKEKREALMRKRGDTVSQDHQVDDDVASLQATTKPSSDAQEEGKENAITSAAMNQVEAEDDAEDDEDDDDEDDWDGFRFRTGR
ncbi:hypothetical protein CCMA1212_005537 [Trichoderma ghanense]|uniref:Coiled-coil domain-containing protein 16 n=1 Tax=Trichoderma ghanense TaxID=65468 RepID=A0ABY2H4C9_9HYPO